MKTRLDEKALLNPGEVAQLYGMNRQHLTQFLRGEALPFLLMYRKRMLIVRAGFDAYLAKRPELKERLVVDVTKKR